MLSTKGAKAVTIGGASARVPGGATKTVTVTSTGTAPATITGGNTVYSLTGTVTLSGAASCSLTLHVVNGAVATAVPLGP